MTDKSIGSRFLDAVNSSPPGKPLVTAMAEVGLATTSQARRYIHQGAVRIGGLQVTDPAHVLPPGTHTVEAGKRKSMEITIKPR